MAPQSNVAIILLLFIYTLCTCCQTVTVNRTLLFYWLSVRRPRTGDDGADADDGHRRHSCWWGPSPFRHSATTLPVYPPFCYVGYRPPTVTIYYYRIKHSETTNDFFSYDIKQGQRTENDKELADLLTCDINVCVPYSGFRR